jgi:MFS transporter, ACS family, tartrate transporter
LLSWGLISAAMLLVKGPESFTLLRLLLGFAEAGFFPGILLYLTYWFPARQRARVVAQFMIASPLVGIVGAPLSGALLQYMDKQAGLHGWQWLFLLEGAPAVLLGVIVLFRLPDRPEQAAWLTPEERSWLTARIASEEHLRQQRHGSSLGQALASPRVWHLILLYSTIAAGISALGYYLPTFIQARFADLDSFEIGLLAAVPSIGTIIGMVLVSGHSDRTGERRWHIAVPAFVAAAGWGMCASLDSPWPSLAALTLAQMGMMSVMGPFWSLPTSFLTGRAAAGGIALINAFGNLGGFAGPNIIAQLQSPSGEFTWGLRAMALVLIASAVLALSARYEPG